jgi:hypothetical protein
MTHLSLQRDHRLHRVSDRDRNRLVPVNTTSLSPQTRMEKMFDIPIEKDIGKYLFHRVLPETIEHHRPLIPQKRNRPGIPLLPAWRVTVDPAMNTNDGMLKKTKTPCLPDQGRRSRVGSASTVIKLPRGRRFGKKRKGPDRSFRP